MFVYCENPGATPVYKERVMKTCTHKTPLMTTHPGEGLLRNTSFVTVYNSKGMHPINAHSDITQLVPCGNNE